jgi:hypothetical protein
MKKDADEHAHRSSFIVHRSDGTDREIRARRRMRARLERRGPTYYALLAVTLLMELDLRLFGRLRSGSYFIVVEKQ